MIAIKAGIRATAVILLAGCIVIGSGAIDPVRLLLPGYHGTGKDLVAHDFGRTRLGGTWPYDGQQVYLLARELPDLKAAARYVDSPRYRLRRILLPALASVGGRGIAVVLLLFLWNVVGIGLGVAGLTDLAVRHGRSPGLGVAAAVALAVPLLVSTTECLGFGLALAGLALVDRRRWVPAIALLALAGLARETALTFALAAAAAVWLDGRRRDAVLVGVLPFLPLAVWSLFVRSYTTRGEAAPVAFLGFIRGSSPSAPDLALAVVILALGSVAVLAWRDVTVVRFTALGFLAWFLFYQADSFDWRALPRLSAPLIAFGLAAVAHWLPTVEPIASFRHSTTHPPK
jgi:hypothetical protein